MAEYTVVEKDTEYVPMWDGNRERADDEQIVFVLRYLTNAQRSKCYSVGIDKRGEPSVEMDSELLIKFGVVSVRGFRAGGKDIATAKDFAELTGFDILFSEVASQVFVMNARTDSGN